MFGGFCMRRIILIATLALGLIAVFLVIVCKLIGQRVTDFTKSVMERD